MQDILQGVFSSLVARIRSVDGKSPDPDKLNKLLTTIKKQLPDYYIEPVAWQEVELSV